MLARSVSPIHVIDDSDPLLGELAEVPAAPREIVDALATIPDPRKRRGVRHPLLEILVVAATAVLSGARSFSAIGDWAADAGVEVLAALDSSAGVPSESTIRRTLERVDGDTFDKIVNSWMGLQFRSIDGRRIVAVDGKTLRGSVDDAGDRPHLLAAMDHESGAVIGQVAVGAKTNEIPKLIDLLDPIDITDMVVTVDALHTQRATADYIVDRGGHFVMCVKRNQPTLYDQLKSLRWNKIGSYTTTDTSRGRRVTHTIKAVEVPAQMVGFDHVGQVIQIRRTRTIKGKRTVEIVYLISDLDMLAAQPHLIADWVQGHWGIENRLHYVRDVTFGEDASRIRTGAGPRVMATLRNLAIAILRNAGHTNIAAALRHTARAPERAIKLLLTSTERTLP